MKKLKWFLLFLVLNLSFLHVKAQKEESVNIETNGFKIEGTLLIPDSLTKMPVAIIIAGSGPTDRDGNNPMMKNNCLKMLADGLCKNNIASLRYDKRGIAKSASPNFKESEIRFDDYIQDVILWINLLRNDDRFSDVIIIGHSQGSLTGMVAAEKAKVEKYISLEGASESIDKIIKKQLSEQPPFVIETANSILDSLAQGFLVKNVPQFLYSMFRPSVQEYMISWMKYNPKDEIVKIDIPVLIVQGTSDIQVSVEDAKNLKEANKNAELIIVDGMNHIFKNAELDRQKNLETYSNPDLPINVLFLNSVVDFIKK